MRKRALWRVALTDLAVLSVFGAVAFAVWTLTERRGAPPLVGAGLALIVLLLGAGGYLSHSLPWWIRAFRD